MMDFMEVLLVAWGQERLCPSIEVSIRSPLGQVDEGAQGVGGHRCLSSVETYVAQSRAVLAVEQALRDLVAERGADGRVLLQLAEVRYARRPALRLDEQRRLLAVARNTYRARVDALHVEVAARLPAIVERLMLLAGGADAARARDEWLAKVRRAQAKAERARALALRAA